VKKQFIVRSILVMAGFGVMLGFQNCSKITASDLVQNAGLNAAAGDPTLGEPVDGGGVNPGPTPDLPKPPVPPPVPPTVPPKKTCDAWDWKHEPSYAHDDKDDDDDYDRDYRQANDSKYTSDDKDGDDYKECHDYDHNDCPPDVARVVAACLGNTKADISGKDVASDLHGSFIIEALKMTSISNVRGSLVVRGTSGKVSSVTKISDSRGSLVICNLSADSIDDTRGNIVLVNSKIKSLTNHRGVVFTYQSTIGSSANISGKIQPIK
jgi:hypothetical protein